ncbi:hypothetical protein H5410_045272 [Solanum commersonii]|uniref:Uncharacterized protein n=1 Tax=Solanum commersonii TaxID=4109 RepID=A0A9J5XC69_SOLCO|nr:hypothetical protein H5410_045272 [Solanum commersonii]
MHRHRLQRLMEYLVDLGHVVFATGRVLTDNVILSHELMKGYGKKDISPKCMFKIHMQKAYDSVERHFI